MNDREYLAAEREAEQIGKQIALDSAMIEGKGRILARFALEMYAELYRQDFATHEDRMALVVAALRGTP